MFGSISQTLALNRKDFQFRNILILVNTRKTESFVLDYRDVYFLLQKFSSYGEGEKLLLILYISVAKMCTFSS